MITQKNRKEKSEDVRVAFFGTDEFAVAVLDELKRQNVVPAIIVSTENKPQGRKLIVTPPPVKMWALENRVEVTQPAVLDSEFADLLKITNCDLFLVASYGKIIPKDILKIPEYHALNIHPSLLPRLRGSSPLEAAILSENETGVTIIRMDEKMDHGPIVAQKKVLINPWPPEWTDLSLALANEGAKLFVESVSHWISGKLKEIPQDENKATYTKKIKKEDGIINLKDNPEKNYRKFLAYTGWPGTFFFKDMKGKKIRFIIKKARFENSQFVIEKVLPEGSKSPIDWPLK